MGESAISIKGLKKDYNVGAGEVHALRGIDMEIACGEFVCIAGKSGSGKSTLLNLVAGLESPTDGSINVLGQRIDRMSEIERIRFRRSHIGFVFQSYRLLPQYTAIENVALPLMLSGMPYREATDRALSWLDRIGLRHLMFSRPGEMSGGQMQRVAIARALCVNPAIIFADEPTGNLDSNTTREVMQLIVDQVKSHGQTLILVTHDRTIADYADKVVTIQDGNIIKIQQNTSDVESTLNEN